MRSAISAQSASAVPHTVPVTWEGDIQYGLVNVLISGVGAGLLHKARGGSFRQAFAQGSLGGGLQYLGRRAAVANYRVAGVVGRSIHVLGASAVRGAVSGTSAFDTLILPIGPVWLEWNRDQGSVGARLDAQAAFWLTRAVVDSNLDVDWGRSLSAGAFVFTSSGPLSDLDPSIGQILGQEAGSVVLLRGDLPAAVMAEAYAHELVHVLQRDASYALFSEPADHFLAELGGDFGLTLSRYVHFGVSDLVWEPAFHSLREAEATALGASR